MIKNAIKIVIGLLVLSLLFFAFAACEDGVSDTQDTPNNSDSPNTSDTSNTPDTSQAIYTVRGTTIIGLTEYGTL